MVGIIECRKSDRFFLTFNIFLLFFIFYFFFVFLEITNRIEFKLVVVLCTLFETAIWFQLSVIVCINYKLNNYFLFTFLLVFELIAIEWMDILKDANVIEVRGLYCT